MAPAFVIYQDEPVVPPPKRRNTEATPVSASTSGSATASKTSAEKENVHPVTGLRAGTKETGNKKRKTVLATKIHNPPTGKKSKESKPDLKKRKTSSKAKGSSSKKDAKDASASGKVKGGKSSTKRFASLQPVDEETDREIQRVQQADIDAKCYELTVLPLADVSEAFEQGSSSEVLLAQRRVKMIRDKSLEPQISDSYAPEHPSLARSAAPSPSDLSATPTVFSTPERKSIYSAFTFETPSKSAERYRRTRTSPISTEAELYEL